MDFRYEPPPLFHGTMQRFSYAPYPPPPYYGRYPLPPFRAGMLPWSEEYKRERTREEVLREVVREALCRGPYSLLYYRPPKDPFLERDYERERIREEVLREEVRRRVIEDEVRWELAMERYYNIRHSNPGYYGTWSNVQFEQPRFSHGCHTTAPRAQVASNHPRPKCAVREVQHKIVEIDEKEMSKTLVSGDKVKPSSKEEIQKKKDEPTVHTEASGNKFQINVGEKPLKITEVYYEEIRRPQALLEDKVQSPKNQEEPRPKASLPEDALTKDKIMPTPNTESIEQKGDGKVLNADSGNKVEQPASSKALLEDKVQSPKNQEEPRPKASLPEDALTKDRIMPTPNTEGIEQKGDGKVLNADSGNKVEQPASSKAPLPEEAWPKDKTNLRPNRGDTEKNGNVSKALKPDSGNKVKQPASKAPRPEEAFPKDKMKPLSNRNGIENEGNGKVLKPETGNKVGQLAFSQSSKTRVLLPSPTLAALGFLPPYPPLSWHAYQNYHQTRVLLKMPTAVLGSHPPYPLLSGPAHRKGYQELLKVAGTCGSKRKGDSISALPNPAGSSSNKVGPKNVKKQKVDRQKYCCTSCQITMYGNSTWLQHLSGKRHQNKLKNITNMETSKRELLVVAETCGSKRKCVSISSLPNPVAAGNSSNESCQEVKKQKVHEKEYSCTFCQLTVNTSQAWLFHLNGKRHRLNTLEKLTNANMTKKVSSDLDSKSTPGIVLSAVKVEMDNGDSLATKPTEELQADKEIIKKELESLPLVKKTKRGRRRRRGKGI